MRSHEGSWPYYYSISGSGSRSIGFWILSAGGTALGAFLALLISDCLMFGLAWANSPVALTKTAKEPQGELESPHPARSYAGESPNSGQEDMHRDTTPSEEQAFHRRGTAATALRAMLAPITGLLYGMDSAQVGVFCIFTRTDRVTI